MDLILDDFQKFTNIRPRKQKLCELYIIICKDGGKIRVVPPKANKSIMPYDSGTSTLRYSFPNPSLEPITYKPIFCRESADFSFFVGLCVMGFKPASH